MSQAKLADNRPRYPGIDLTKFFMSICVIALHTLPMIHCENQAAISIYYSIADCAVPFFFIASGFLLAQKMKWPYGTPANLPAIRKTLKKIVRLYLIWSLIYLPLAIANYISTSTPFFEAFVSYSVWFVIVGEHYNSWMLWYLLATIYALIYVSLMSRKNVPFECKRASASFLRMLRFFCSAQF